MGRAILSSIVIALAASLAWAQNDGPGAESRTVLGGVNQDLAKGAELIRAGEYDEGIRSTLLGLEDKSISARDRAAGLSNICAAYAGKNQPDAAIRYCTESLAISSKNWQAYSNRSYAYWLMGRYSEATFDLDAASALSPKARVVAQIRGMINEARLEPNIRMEDLN